MSHNQISEKKNNAELAGLQKKPYFLKKELNRLNQNVVLVLGHKKLFVVCIRVLDVEDMSFLVVVGCKDLQKLDHARKHSLYRVDD